MAKRTSGRSINRNYITLTSSQEYAALKWALGVLEKHQITYQIAGGLAARIYGSYRTLIDIDIEVPNGAIFTILEDLYPYLIYGPSRFKDTEWDLLLATVNYHGVVIDFNGGDDCYVFNRAMQQWVVCPALFSHAVQYTIEEQGVWVIQKKDLIKYKTLLSRPVDLLDLAAFDKMM